MPFDTRYATLFYMVIFLAEKRDNYFYLPVERVWKSFCHGTLGHTERVLFSVKTDCERNLLVLEYKEYKSKWEIYLRNVDKMEW